MNKIVRPNPMRDTYSLQIDNTHGSELSSKQVLGLTPTHAITLRQVRHKKHSDNDKYTLESSIYSLLCIPRVDDLCESLPKRHRCFLPIDVSLSRFYLHIYIYIRILYRVDIIIHRPRNKCWVIVQVPAEYYAQKCIFLSIYGVTSWRGDSRLT